MTDHRVLLLNGSLFRGGAEHMIATLARQLRCHGHHVTIGILTRGRDLPAELAAEGLDVLSGIGTSNDGRPVGIRQTVRSFATLVRSRRIDVVHTHDAQSLSIAGLGGRVTPVAHLHTFHFGNYPNIGWKTKLLERTFSRFPHQLVAVGRAQHRELVKALRLSPERVSVVWNGIDPRLQSNTPRHQGEPLIVGSISSFVAQKGLPTLLEAVQLVRRSGLAFKLQLIGDGPLRPQIEAEAVTRGLADVVEFSGWVPDARRLLASIDIFVQSSYWEAMSVVILEAMAAGKPIVATAVGDNADVLRDGESALLAPPRDGDRLATCLIRVLRDQPLRQKLAAGAHAAFCGRFTASEMTRTYLRLYEKALCHSPSNPLRRSDRLTAVERAELGE